MASRFALGYPQLPSGRERGIRMNYIRPGPVDSPMSLGLVDFTTLPST